MVSTGLIGLGTVASCFLWQSIFIGSVVCPYAIADTPYADDQVQVRVHQPTGPGHCDGEVSVFFTNNSNQPVDCSVTWFRNGKRSDGGSVTVMPGKTIGGEMGGLSSCNADPTVHTSCTYSDARYGNPPDCPDYPNPIPQSARECRAGETPTVEDFYAKNKVCSWCY